MKKNTTGELVQSRPRGVLQQSMNLELSKKTLILEDEERFAYVVSESVFEKPQISVWMVLIPIILVFHMYRHQRYVNNRKSFAENYLIDRRQALEEAYSSFTDNRKPDFAELIKLSDVPNGAAKKYNAWLEMIASHYQNLFHAEGDSYDALIRSSYKNRANYLRFLNKLNDVERQFNAALKPCLEKTAESVDEIVTQMEKCSEALRKDQAIRIFSRSAHESELSRA
ncbi:MAG: NF038143 family protein [Desulfobacteraceae bacterium]|nr:NF038143 family protein [Desulfobacteraceae bacterium]